MANLAIPAAVAEWGEAKRAHLAAGYATQWDRRTAALIRRRQRDGIMVTPQQLQFAEQVERIIRGNL